METQNTISKKAKVTGWILSGIAILFLLLDSVGKFMKPEAVIKGTTELGYPVSVITTLGTILLISTVIYAIPRTAFFGALLLTGYFGGAIATHVRVENPLFTHTLFPVYLALFVWGGLYLRNIRLRKLIEQAMMR